MNHAERSKTLRPLPPSARGSSDVQPRPALGTEGLSRHTTQDSRKSTQEHVLRDHLDETFSSGTFLKLFYLDRHTKIHVIRQVSVAWMEHSRSHCSRSRVGNLSFVRLHLLVFLLFFAPTCAGARTCDYRVVEEATYSAFNLTALGLNGSTSIAMNGDFSGAHGRAQSIQSFVAQSEAYVRNLAVTGIAPKVHDGVNTTDMITLDIELPVDWKIMARGCAGCWNDNWSRRRSRCATRGPILRLGILPSKRNDSSSEIPRDGDGR